MTLGVRAEDLHLHQSEVGELPRGRIDVVEHHGHEDLLHVRCGDKVLSVRSVAHKSPPPGTDTALVVSPQNCHLFQRRDGQGDGSRLEPYGQSEAAA